MKKIYHEIAQCRICGNKELISILHLGDQYLTGVFPKTKNQEIPCGPLELVKCDNQNNSKNCGLVQLRHSYESSALYGDGYGYRSSLNQSMVNHLKAKVDRILSQGILKQGDMVVDVGSNDGTLLKCYPSDGLTIIGVDPTGKAFKKYYPAHIDLLPNFFSADLIKGAYGLRKVKVLTSIAMFYDLKAPVEFMKQVYDILDDEGIWILEQSHMPTMLEHMAYDTVCHEHLEYYGLKQISWMAQKVGLNIIEVNLNDTNGGSFEVTIAKKGRPEKKEAQRITDLLAKEERMGLSTLRPYENFRKKVFAHRDNLRAVVEKINAQGKKIIGYGASTKGNVILQFCGLTSKDIPFIAEVNGDKVGSCTPGTHIPIISEEEARAMKPDYMMVLPWHFKENIIAREQAYLKGGGRLFFPLPELEIVGQ